MKLLINTKEGAASQKSNEIDLKLDNYQLNRNSFDTSGLCATWPEFWAIGMSFSGLCAFFIIWPPRPLWGGSTGTLNLCYVINVRPLKGVVEVIEVIGVLEEI